jgi:hypothetical protein
VVVGCHPNKYQKAKNKNSNRNLSYNLLMATVFHALLNVCKANELLRISIYDRMHAGYQIAVMSRSSSSKTKKYKLNKNRERKKKEKYYYWCWLLLNNMGL